MRIAMGAMRSLWNQGIRRVAAIGYCMRVTRQRKDRRGFARIASGITASTFAGRWMGSEKKAAVELQHFERSFSRDTKQVLPAIRNSQLFQETEVYNRANVNRVTTSKLLVREKK
jgi:hypothetical protein